MRIWFWIIIIYMNFYIDACANTICLQFICLFETVCFFHKCNQTYTRSFDKIYWMSPKLSNRREINIARGYPKITGFHVSISIWLWNSIILALTCEQRSVSRIKYTERSVFSFSYFVGGDSRRDDCMTRANENTRSISLFLASWDLYLNERYLKIEAHPTRSLECRDIIPAFN